VKMAACPSPVAIGDGRIFITSGYEAGSMMIQVEKGAAGFTAKKIYGLTAAQFNSEVHTPILYKNHLFAVGSKTRGRFTCLGLDGKPCGKAPSPRETLRRRGRSSSAGSCWPTGCSSCWTGYRARSASSRRARRSTRNWRAPGALGRRRVGPAGAFERPLVIRDMNQMYCLQVGPIAGAK